MSADRSQDWLRELDPRPLDRRTIGIHLEAKGGIVPRRFQ
jgi:hypothetical protein